MIWCWHDDFEGLNVSMVVVVGRRTKTNIDAWSPYGGGGLLAGEVVVGGEERVGDDE